MKRYLILFIALLSLINIGYAQSFSTATDNTCFITITTPQNTSMNARKELCRVHQFSDRVDLITVDNNLVICTWTKAQATSYGYTLEALEQYLLSILNVSCGASSAAPSPNAGDSLLLSELVKINSRIDTTQQDTAIDKSVTISNLESYRKVLDSINNKLHSIAFDTSTIDTSLVAQIDYTPYLQKLVSIGYDTSQIDTALINYLVQFDTTINRLDSILASIKRQSSIDTTHTAIFQSIQDSINSKFSILDKSDIDTSIVQVIQLNQIIDSLSTLINKSNIDTTHTAILNEIKYLVGKLDTSSIDTSLVPAIDYNDLFYALINKGYDTSQVDTALDKHILLDSTSVRIINDSIKVWFTQPLEVSKDTTHQTILSEIKELLTVINSRVDTTQQDTSLDKSIKLDSTLVRIINDTLNVRFIDSTYYTQLDSIKYFLSQSDSIEICFDTVTFQTYVTNLPTTICNGDSAVRVQLCNVDSTLNEIVRTKIDTTNAILYRIENKSPFNYDTQEQFEVAGVGSTITLSPNNYHSISYTIISGVANVDIGGVLINGLPSGYTANYEATTTLTNQITITTVTSNSRVIITTIK